MTNPVAALARSVFLFVVYGCFSASLLALLLLSVMEWLGALMPAMAVLPGWLTEPGPREVLKDWAWAAFLPSSLALGGVLWWRAKAAAGQ